MKVSKQKFNEKLLVAAFKQDFNNNYRLKTLNDMKIKIGINKVLCILSHSSLSYADNLYFIYSQSH